MGGRESAVGGDRARLRWEQLVQRETYHRQSMEGRRRHELAVVFGYVVVAGLMMKSAAEVIPTQDSTQMRWSYFLGLAIVSVIVIIMLAAMEWANARNREAYVAVEARLDELTRTRSERGDRPAPRLLRGWAGWPAATGIVAFTCAAGFFVANLQPVAAADQPEPPTTSTTTTTTTTTTMTPLAPATSGP